MADHPKRRLLKFTVPLVLGAVIWFVPAPAGVDAAAIHLLAIFVAMGVAFLSRRGRRQDA